MLKPIVSGLVVVLAVSGCAGAIQNQARKAAAADHGCPLENISLVSDASVGMEHAYWFSVCGQKRYYRYQETSTAGLGSGRFLDDTGRFASGPK
jgi:hypothetical protein